MTLDEAIKRYTDNAEFERRNGNLQGCLDFKQLAEWLKDYKRLLEQEPILDKIRDEISAILTNSYDEGVKEKALQIIDKYRGMNRWAVRNERF